MNSDAVAIAPPVIACWTNLSLEKFPSPKDRRAPVTAPPIAAFFCRPQPPQMSDLSTMGTFLFLLKYISSNRKDATVLQKCAGQIGTQSCFARAFSREYSTPAYTPATAPAFRTCQDIRSILNCADSHCSSRNKLEYHSFL
jgi:hypothetical protein